MENVDFVKRLVDDAEGFRMEGEVVITPAQLWARLEISEKVPEPARKSFQMCWDNDTYPLLLTRACESLGIIIDNVGDKGWNASLAGTVQLLASGCNYPDEAKEKGLKEYYRSNL